MNYGPDDTAGIVGLFVVLYAVILGVTVLLSVAIYVVSGIAFMRLYRKTGVEPWAAWVPFFNNWRLLELGGQPGWLAVLQIIPGVNYVTAVFQGISAYKIGTAFRKEGAWVVLFLFLPFVWAFLLASDREHYDPSLMAARGWNPPLAGFGSARGPYVPPQNPAPPAA